MLLEILDMRLNHQRLALLHKLSLFSSNISTMASKNLFKFTAFPIPLTSSSQGRLFQTHGLLFTSFSSKPVSKICPFSLQTNGYSFNSHTNVPRPEEKRLDPLQFKMLKQKLEELGVDCQICVPGQDNQLLCPMCKGGDSSEKTLSLFVTQDGGSALWMCSCGWRGSTRAFADSSSSYDTSNQVTKVKKKREITEESLQLEPLCDEGCQDHELDNFAIIPTPPSRNMLKIAAAATQKARLLDHCINCEISSCFPSH